MELLSKDEFSDLMEQHVSPCVSVYIPTHRVGKTVEQDPIRLKNALREARDKLTDSGTRATEADEILAPAQALVPDGRFWRYQSDGLAVFLAPGFSRQLRLPIAFEPLVVVSDRFHIKPLLPLLTGDGRFYILALSQKDVRLLEATRYSVETVELENVPKSLADALKYDIDVPHGQVRGFTRDVSPKPGPHNTNSAMFHGHGVSEDYTTHKEDIQQFFIQLDRGLRDILREGRAPLILAAVEYLVPIYQDVNTYPHLMPESVRGNPELLRPEEIHEKAWRFVEPEFKRAQQTAVELYRDLLESGRTSDSIAEIVPAAQQGRVDCLFITSGIKIWGDYNEGAGEVRVYLDKRPGSQDLLDLAAYHTLANSGKVYALEPAEMPDASPAAAILRY